MMQHMTLVTRATENALQHIATPLCVLPSKKMIDAIKPEKDSTMREEKSKTEHKMCEEP